MGNLYSNKYYHRDLSWLRFNHRVLQEAADIRNPIYERIKFLAIFSSNLDEFYKVRVSDIRQIKQVEKPLRKKLITKPNKLLREINAQVEKQQEEFGNIFQQEILPELERNRIHLIDYREFSSVHKEITKTYYQEQLKGKIEIQVSLVADSEKIFIENEELYLIGLLGNEKLIIVKIPETESRFFEFPEYNGKHYITFIDDILKYNLNQNPEAEHNISFYAVKKSRDAELYIEEEFSGNVKDKIEKSLSKRETGQATRLLIDKHTPKHLQEIILQKLEVSKADIIMGGTYHNFKDFFGFPNPTEKKLTYPTLPPLPHNTLTNAHSIFNLVQEKDRLLHFPYQAFDPLIELLKEAAEDPTITTLKITIYRAAENSKLNEYIALAAEKGKEVVIFIEVKARFDEQNNLKWGKIFEENGAKVIYSFPAIKVHSKIMYLERQTKNGTESLAYISTGNFNENTAKVYTDFGLLTSHPEITEDIHKVFLVLEGKMIIPRASKLLVSPFSARENFRKHIEKEIEFAQQGKQAYIIAKMNSLEDKEMIKMLYKANNAGVQIKLLVRGICSLIPGIKGQSERITATSIVDRFLEHARVYCFGNDGQEKMFIGSADWMKRNLDHRIEVITPVLDRDIQHTIKKLLEFQLQDNVKARVIEALQENNYVSNNQQPMQAQLATYEFFKNQI